MFRVLFIFSNISIFCLLGCSQSQSFRPALDPIASITNKTGPQSCNQSYLAWQAEHENLIQALEEQNQLGIFQAHSRILAHLGTLKERCGCSIARLYQQNYQNLYQQIENQVPPRILLPKYQEIKKKALKENCFKISLN